MEALKVGHILWVLDDNYDIVSCEITRTKDENGWYRALTPGDNHEFRLHESWIGKVWFHSEEELKRFLKNKLSL